MQGTQKVLPSTLYELDSTLGLFSKRSIRDTKAGAFETVNGESVLAFYNPVCKTQYLNEEQLTTNDDLQGYPQENMCVNFM